MQDYKDLELNLSVLKSIRRSSNVELYKEFLGYEEFLKNDCHHQNHFQREGIYFNPQKDFIEKMSLQIVYETLNSQALMLQVSWGYFTTHLTLLNINSNSHNHSFQSCVGGFGEVYIDDKKESSKAIKCLKYKSTQWKNRTKLVAIKEYFLAKIASSLKVGPYISNKLGFDLLLYNQCIQFSMQICKKGRMDFNFYLQAMKQNLCTLHKYNYCHFDIKPSNIMFSEHFCKPVFIDFGLSMLIKEKLGQLSFINFKGTIDYCSQEMKTAFYTQKEQWIDTYYNDAFALKKSLSEYISIQKILLDPQDKEQEYILINQYAIISMKDKQKMKILMNIKYNLFVPNKIRIKSIFTKYKKNINNNLMQEVLQFLQVLQPTAQIADIYCQMSTQLKKSTRFYKINKILSENHVFDAYIYQSYAQYYEKQLIQPNKQFQSLQITDEESDITEKITKQKMIELLTAQKSLSNNPQRYFLVLIRFINFTNNLFDANLQERVKVVEYCLKNIFNYSLPQNQPSIMKINVCIVNILQWFCNKDNIKQNSEKDKEIKQITLFSLIQHLFILGRTDSAKLTSLLSQLQAIYFTKISQKIYFIFRIRIFMMWLVERYDHFSPYRLIILINDLEKWCYSQYIHIASFSQSKYTHFLTFLKYLLPMTGNKNRLQIFTIVQVTDLLVFSKEINEQIQLYYTMITLYKLNDFGKIAKMVKIQQISRLFPWTFRLYWYFFYRLNLQDRRRIYKIIKYNLQNTQIISQFLIQDTQKLLQCTRYNQQYQKILEKIISKVNFINIILQPKFMEIVLNEFNQIITKSKHSKQTEKVDQTVMNKLLQLRQWPYQSQSLAHQQGNHFCYNFDYLHTMLYIHLYSFIKEQNSIQSENQLKILKNIFQKTQCLLCKNGLEIFIQINALSLNKQNLIAQKQFIAKHFQIQRLINNYAQLIDTQAENFNLTNYYLFAVFCISSQQTQSNYGGLKRLYHHLKLQNYLQNYITHPHIKRVLLVTLQVIYDNSQEQFFYFINKLCLHVNNVYNWYSFRFLLQQNDSLVGLIKEFNFQLLLQKLESVQTTQKKHLFMFYYLIIFDFTKKLYPIDLITKLKKKILKMYALCSWKIQSHFKIYFYLCYEYLQYKNLVKRKILFVFKKAIKELLIKSHSQLSWISKNHKKILKNIPIHHLTKWKGIQSKLIKSKMIFVKKVINIQKIFKEINYKLQRKQFLRIKKDERQKMINE